MTEKLFETALGIGAPWYVAASTAAASLALPSANALGFARFALAGRPAPARALKFARTAFSFGSSISDYSRAATFPSASPSTSCGSGTPVCLIGNQIAGIRQATIGMMYSRSASN